MSGDEEAENFLFRREPLMLIPVWSVGQRLLGRSLVFLVEDAEEAMLAHGRVALRFLRVFHGSIHHRHKLRTSSQGIHRAALDKRLNNALIKQPQVHLLAKLED